MDDNFDPKRYGMLFCLKCNGSGKLLNDSDHPEICSKCGGFGFIKKKKESDRKKELYIKDSKAIVNK